MRISEWLCLMLYLGESANIYYAATRKSYADQRQKPLKFKEGEHVFLKVTSTTRVGRAIKTKNLNPRYMGPFHILKRIGPVAYRITFPLHLSNLHDMFHMSRIQKFTPDFNHVLKPESVQVKESLTLQSQARIEEHMWKLESEMWKDYPHLFSGSMGVRMAWKMEWKHAKAEGNEDLKF
ncbi:uncharacterized protein [Arachis hypogaea]|uniref:uncharacterized protein n=1 Tax=Arachis hypogaea TaxID=3818 RepID=UPI000DEC84EE|nr:uncharacterized protein LOC112701581 [Arachis hypogaea]